MTLKDCLLKWNDIAPDKCLYRFLDNGKVVEEISISSFLFRCEQLARYLSLYLQPGDRVILLYPPGPDLNIALMSCFIAGVVAVPSYLPLNNKLIDKLQRIIDDCKPMMILSTVKIKNKIENLKLLKYVVELPLINKITNVIFKKQRDALHWPFEKYKWLITDKLPLITESQSLPIVKAEQIAFLQYTSGSTGYPKGVMVTHENIVHNLEIISKVASISKDEVAVQWLPPYHDMGLFNGILLPIFGGFTSILMSPQNFLKNPLIWLRAIDEYQGTYAGGPNFAFDYCVNKISQSSLANLNLSSWRICYNGSEPIRYETLNNFAEYFAKAKFNDKSFAPCYGMAEATVMVSTSYNYKEPPREKILSLDKEGLRLGEVKLSDQLGNSQILVSCGVPLLTVKIVNPKTHTECPPDTIGEIWISGTSVTKGYWNKPKLTARYFKAQIKGSEEYYLRSGDLGFLHEKQLYVTGRIKDLIIVRGRNHYPQDLEKTVEKSHPMVRRGCVAAFSFEKEENIAVVCEINDNVNQSDYKTIAKRILTAIARNHDLRLSKIVLISPKTIPKTTSGKIRRRATRQMLTDNELPVLYEWSSKRQVENHYSPILKH